MTWLLVFQFVRGMEEDHWGRSRGETLMAQLTLRWLSSHQSLTEKAATWRRNHYSFNHLSYSAEHTYPNTHTLGHKRVHTSLVGVQRLISVTTRVENTAGHLAPPLQLSCSHIKAKHTIWLFLYQLIIQITKLLLFPYITGCGPHT